MNQKEKDEKLHYLHRMIMFESSLRILEMEIDKKFQKYEQDHVLITKLLYEGYRYSFPLNRRQLPERLKECTLILVTQRKYSKVYNSEKDAIIASIIEYKDDHLVFYHRRNIDVFSEYHVKFIPNRIFFRACYDALKTIKDNQLHLFFSKFEDVPRNNIRKEIGTFKDFQWFNEDVGNNERQMIAVEKIVNCTAFPFPFVVFGPPGEFVHNFFIVLKNLNF